MKNKFTQGPWVSVTGDAPELMFRGERSYFPHVKIGMRGDIADRLIVNVGGGPFEEHDANARLIGAAPKLYDACEKAQRLIEDMARFVGQMALQDYANFNEAPMALAAALAEVRGVK